MKRGESEMQRCFFVENDHAVIDVIDRAASLLNYRPAAKSGTGVDA